MVMTTTMMMMICNTRRKSIRCLLNCRCNKAWSYQHHDAIIHTTCENKCPCCLYIFCPSQARTYCFLCKLHTNVTNIHVYVICTIHHRTYCTACVVLSDPSCPRPSIALQVQNRGLKTPISSCTVRSIVNPPANTLSLHSVKQEAITVFLILLCCFICISGSSPVENEETIHSGRKCSCKQYGPSTVTLHYFFSYTFTSIFVYYVYFPF